MMIDPTLSLVPPEEAYTDARERLIDILARAVITRRRAPTPKERAAIAYTFHREIDALCNSTWQPAELVALQDVMADLLTRTADALHGGPPEDGGMWSWQDLPVLAAATVEAGRRPQRHGRSSTHPASTPGCVGP